MGVYSRTVYECSPIRRGEPTAVDRHQACRRPAHPGRVGDASPIKYVVYIIKENRTYDQVFGDMPEGNGDAHLCLFPESVTPNHHALAREFVLLDNFYVDGEVERRWARMVDGRLCLRLRRAHLAALLSGRPPRAVSLGRQLEIARPAGGYLWDRAAEKGVTYRSYGEFIENGKTPDEPGIDQGQGLARPLRPSLPHL